MGDDELSSPIDPFACTPPPSLFVFVIPLCWLGTFLVQARCPKPRRHQASKPLPIRLVRSMHIDLSVILFNSVAAKIVAPVAARASLATPSRTTRGDVVPIPDADPEEDGGDQDSAHGAPGEAESPHAKL